MQYQTAKGSLHLDAGCLLSTSLNLSPLFTIPLFTFLEITSTPMKTIFQSACFLSFALLISGCGGDGRPPLAPVSGVVTLSGAPVAGATISFIPVDGGRVGTALTDRQGRYEMSTFPGDDADGALLGEHRVTVMKVGGSGASKPATADGEFEDEDEDAGLAPASGELDNSTEVDDDEDDMQYLVPARYMNPDTSDLTITVESGGTEHGDFELTR